MRAAPCFDASWTIGDLPIEIMTNGSRSGSVCGLGSYYTGLKRGCLPQRFLASLYNLQPLSRRQYDAHSCEFDGAAELRCDIGHRRRHELQLQRGSGLRGVADGFKRDRDGVRRAIQGYRNRGDLIVHHDSGLRVDELGKYPRRTAFPTRHYPSS